MNVSGRRRQSLLLSVAGVVLAFLMVGCGGGGGGTSTITYVFGRSYQFLSGAQAVAISTDSTGRFTLFAQDGSAIATGTGGQGTVDTSGRIVAQSLDGTVQFSGTLASDSKSITGTVTRNGTTLFSYTANLTDTGAATANSLIGTYSGSNSAGTDAYLSLDTVSRGAFWIRTPSASGGGLITLNADGTFQSANGTGIAGQLTTSGSAYSLTLSRLNGTSVSITLPVSRATRAKWTFLVYLNAANNLQEFSVLNVNQMEKIGSTADVNVVIQWKQAGCSSCGNPAWLGTRRYYVQRDNDTNTINSRLVQDMGQSIDMGDWRELHNFVQWGQQNYPADHYALVIWNHGAGWRPTRSNRLEPSFRSVSIDDSTNSEIQIWQLPSALDVTPKLDMVVFDASLMQMTEVAYEIRNSAKLVVGSEESPPGEGYAYDTFLSDLTGNPSLDPFSFGTQIVTRTYDYYQANFPVGSDQRSRITQSAIDLSKMQAVADNLNAFANTLNAHTSDSAAAMQTARNSAQTYAYADNKDLWDYAELIRTGATATDLKNAAVNMQTAITNALIAERHSSGRPNSHGLAIYVPQPSGYLPSYANLALSRVTNWSRWLQNQP